VTAYNNDGLESLPSNEVSVTPAPPHSVNLATRSIDPADAGDYVPPGPQPAGIISSYARERLAGGAYEFAIKGTAGQSLSIFASENLITWMPLGTVNNPTGILVVTDLAAISLPSRFYFVIGN
jgi:hypothetical protein